jgi:16S rRNA (uracil1498-N3)-methyltransferase
MPHPARGTVDTTLRSSAAHVIVVSLEDPVIDAEDAHHLARVLRLRDGQIVTATDGAGRWRACRFLRGGQLEADGPVVVTSPPQPALTVGFAPVKGERVEWAVQKLTELGVDRIVPLRAARSVVRWDGERADAAVARLRRVAREAVMQSRRVWVPTVTDVAIPADVPDACLAEPGGAPPSLARPAVLVGPEGGWAPEELAGAAATVSLGEQVLRSETAALAAAAIFGALRSRSVVAASQVG